MRRLAVPALALIALSTLAPRASAVALSHGTYFAEGMRIVVTAAAFSDGGVIIAGQGATSSLPVTPGAYQTSPGIVFVARIDLATGALQWCTTLGPAAGEVMEGPRMAAAPDGTIWIAGSTDLDMPTTADAWQPARTGDRDVWFGRLSADGANLLHGGWFGGPGIESATVLRVAADGDVVIAGRVTGGMTPQLNPVEPPSLADPGSDGFAARFSADGGTLRFATHVTGDVFTGVADAGVAPDGRVHLAGSFSHDQSADDGGFVKVIEPLGGTTAWSFRTPHGIQSAAVDAASRTHVVTNACDGPNAADDPVADEGSACVMRILPGGDVDFRARFGRQTSVNRCALDSAGTLHVAGNTMLGDVTTTTDALQPMRDAVRGWYGYVVRVDADAARISYASWVGANRLEGLVNPVGLPMFLAGVGVAPSGATAVVGWTKSGEFPVTANACQPTFPMNPDGATYAAGFVHVTGPSFFVHAMEPSALDMRTSAVPLRVQREAASVLVGWEETLGDKFGMYMGTLESLWRRRTYDHVPTLGGCSLFTSPATIPLPAGNAYFLVSSITPDEESSHGRDSGARERPHGPSPCR